jgi:hypothetical protein
MAIKQARERVFHNVLSTALQIIILKIHQGYVLKCAYLDLGGLLLPDNAYKRQIYVELNGLIIRLICV